MWFPCLLACRNLAQTEVFFTRQSHQTCIKVSSGSYSSANHLTNCILPLLAHANRRSLPSCIRIYMNSISASTITNGSSAMCTVCMSQRKIDDSPRKYHDCNTYEHLSKSTRQTINYINDVCLSPSRPMHQRKDQYCTKQHVVRNPNGVYSQINTIWHLACCNPHITHVRINN